MDFFSYGDVAPKPPVHDFKYPLEDFGRALEKTRITTTLYIIGFEYALL